MDNQKSYLQGIIGTDKKNPFYTVYQHSKTMEYHVYYGFNLYDIVPSNKENPQLKILVAKLFRAGISAAELHRSFGYCYRTIKRFTEALQSENGEDMVKAFEGRTSRKLTDEIIGFAKYEFKKIYPTNRKNYSQLIRKSIEEVFNVKISSETLRPIFNELKIALLKDEKKKH
jgi:transposase